MKLLSISLCILTTSVLLPGCANLRPSADTSRSVIDLLVAPDQQDTPWRLGVAWQSGGQGGAALRSAGVEHVVRKKSPDPFRSASVQVAQVSPIGSPTDSEENIERAWRKFCRYQLDMTERDRQIIRDTTIPGWLIGQCHSGSLLK